MRSKLMIKALLAAATIWSGVVHAQDKPVTLDAGVLLERPAAEGSDAGVRLVAPEGVVPGDVLVFTTRYRNGSGEGVSDFVIVNPVPPSVQLTAESAGETEVSVDGGSRWGALAALTVAEADGVLRPATASDVTHLRWTIARLGPGEAGMASFRAMVR